MDSTTREGMVARLLPAVDLLVLGVAFVAAYLLRFGMPAADATRHQAAHLLMGFGLLAGWLPALFMLDLYQPAHFAHPRALLGRVAQAVLLVALLAAAFLFIVQGKLASRLVFGATLVLGGGGAWAVRLLFARLCTRERRRVLVVGAGEAVLPRSLTDRHVVRFLSADEARSSETALELATVLDREVVDHVLIALPAREWHVIDEIADVCAEVGVDLSIVAPLSERVLARAAPDRLFGAPVLRLDASPQFRAAMIGKRAFDIVVSLLLLPVAVPVMLIAALAVRWTSKGPAFFVQERVGLHGRIFRFYKLRTMVDGAGGPPRLAGNPAYKPETDPRVTVVGGVLRRLSIDELPQLFNVLKGDMSLVGPRPPLPDEVARYDRWQRRRLSMRPGLTCTWQVSGRSRVGFDEWMRLDLDYIDNWSLWLDLKILLKTVPAVVTGKGAR